jgi:hypothetical protein
MNKEISYERLKELERAERKLGALERNGVDNWGGYDGAMDDIRKETEKEEKMETALCDIEQILMEGVYEPSERGTGFSTTAEAHERAFLILKKLLNEPGETKE